MKPAFSFICVISVLAGFLRAAPSDFHQWKGKIEDEEGIKIIRNPTDPLYGEIEFDLEEDLSIGN